MTPILPRRPNLPLPRANPILQLDHRQLSPSQQPCRLDRVAARDQRRLTEATAALTDWTPPRIDLYGFTRGTFSLIELIIAILDRIGPAQLDLCTWCAGRRDLKIFSDLLTAGTITNTRWLCDLSLGKRTPDIADQLHALIGHDNIRICHNHAKFAVLTSAQHQLTLMTSMNLNFNPRLENYLLTSNSDLHQFHRQLFDEHFRASPAGASRAAAD